MPDLSGSLIGWTWFPLEPSVQGRKYETAQAGGFSHLCNPGLLFNIVAFFNTSAFLADTY
jgi:hypothetical protein